MSIGHFRLQLRGACLPGREPGEFQGVISRIAIPVNGDDIRQVYPVLACIVIPGLRFGSGEVFGNREGRQVWRQLRKRHRTEVFINMPDKRGAHRFVEQHPPRGELPQNPLRIGTQQHPDSDHPPGFIQTNRHNIHVHHRNLVPDKFEFLGAEPRTHISCVDFTHVLNFAGLYGRVVHSTLPAKHLHFRVEHRRGRGAARHAEARLSGMRQARYLNYLALAILALGVLTLAVGWYIAISGHALPQYGVILALGTVGAVACGLGYWSERPWIFGAGSVFMLWFAPTPLGLWPLGIGIAMLIAWAVLIVKENNVKFW